MTTTDRPLMDNGEQQILHMWYEVADHLSDLMLNVLRSIGEMLRTDKMSYAKIALACLIAKSRLDYLAMISLCKSDQCGPARILARVVMDSCITALYIGKNPLVRGEQFWQHEFQQRVDLGKKADNLTPLPSNNLAKLAEWQKFIYAFEGSNKKHGRLTWPNVGDMILDLDLDIDIVNLLSATNKGFSFEVHALPLILVNMFVEYHGETVRVSPEPREADRVTHVFVSSLLLYLTLQLARNAFDLSIDDPLATIHATLEEIDKENAKIQNSATES